MSGITSHHLLARLLTITAGSDAGWGDDDLGDILAHQLRMPLLAASGGAPSPGVTSRSGSGSQVSFVTFSDALLDPAPELPLLERIKDFAKDCRMNPDSTLPAEVAMILYFGSIVAARLRCGATITSMDDDALRNGVRWVLNRPWLDHGLRPLFSDAERALGPLGTEAPAGRPQ